MASKVQSGTDKGFENVKADAMSVNWQLRAQVFNLVCTVKPSCSKETVYKEVLLYEE